MRKVPLNVAVMIQEYLLKPYGWLARALTSHKQTVVALLIRAP